MLYTNVDMLKVVEVIDNIEKTNGTNDKIGILRKNGNNELLKKILFYTYNSDLQFGVKKTTINKFKYSRQGQSKWTNLFDMLDELARSNINKDLTREVELFLQDEEEFKDLYIRILLKDMRIGLNVKNINKAIPNLIPTFEIMLGSKGEIDRLPNEEMYVTEKFDGCFVKDTNILMGDGTNKQIKDIRVGDEVLSFNEYTKEVSVKKVVNIFRNGYKPKEEWLRIKYYTEFGKTGFRSINVTKSHKIFTENGWIKASDIKKDDYIYIYEYIPSQEEISVLLGIGMGDGSVIKDNINISPTRFGVAYVDNNTENERLNKYKMLFKNNCGNDFARISGYGSEIKGFNIKTYRNLPKFMTDNKNIKKTSYRLNEEILSNVDWLTLATFYMDDGHKIQCKDDGNDVKNVRPRACFTLARQDEEEILLFAEFLKSKLNSNDINIYYEKKLKNKTSYSYKVSLGVEATEILFDNIAKYIPKCLRYKIGKKWENVEECKWWEKSGEFGLVKVRVGEINQSFLKSRRKKAMSYDLEIEGNHTYFANKVAVHNCRCFTQIRNGQVIMKSRQNKVFEGLVDIVKDIKALGLDNVCLDGELLAIDVGNEDVYKETMKRVSVKDMEKHGVKYMLFDVLPLLEFDKKIGLVKYSDRRRKLESISETEFIKIAPLLYRGKEVNEILTILDEYRNKGSEGLMINVDKPYEFKRSKTLLKLKVMSTVDLRVIGLEEGEGRLAGTLGNIIVEYKGNTVKVGSGFSLKQRDEIWNSPCDYLNKIVEIQYFEETTNEQGTLSLRFPIFKQWRFDKDEPSYE